jgi:hypothetical protein
MRIHGSNFHAEVFLSSAYQRIQRITIVLAGIAAGAVTLAFGWRSGLGSLIGAIVGYLNLVWLHHGSTVIIERMLAPADKAGSKSRLMLAFLGRYVFLMTIAYVILKGFSSMLFGFTVALFLPILAAMCEGIYEAYVNVKTDETPDETSLH